MEKHGKLMKMQLLMTEGKKGKKKLKILVLK